MACGLRSFTLVTLTASLALAGRASAATGWPMMTPMGCEANTCNQFGGYDNNLPTDALDPHDIKTWTEPKIGEWERPLTGFMGQFRGVYTPLEGSPIAAKPSTFEEWLSLRVTPGTKWLHFGKFAFEPSTQTQYPGTLTLGKCCNMCRVSAQCAMYRFEPIGGKCFSVTGGSVKGTGPYDMETQRELGMPPIDDSLPVSNFLGGYCNPAADVKDDPHFTGAHGVRFDFSGQLGKAFCLVSDARLHVNALLEGYHGLPGKLNASSQAQGQVKSWIRELGFVWRGGRTLRLVARGGKDQERGAQGFVASALLDGRAVALPSQPGQALESGDLRVVFLGVRSRRGLALERYELSISGLLRAAFSLRAADPRLQTAESAMVHFNLMISDIQASSRIHGVLGQTYRNTEAQLAKVAKFSSLARLLRAPIQADGPTGAGFLEGQAEDYVASDVLKPDCKVAAYTGA